MVIKKTRGNLKPRARVSRTSQPRLVLIEQSKQASALEGWACQKCQKCHVNASKQCLLCLCDERSKLGEAVGSGRRRDGDGRVGEWMDGWRERQTDRTDQTRPDIDG